MTRTPTMRGLCLWVVSVMWSLTLLIVVMGILPLTQACPFLAWVAMDTDVTIMITTTTITVGLIITARHRLAGNMLLRWLGPVHSVVPHLVARVL